MMFSSWFYLKMLLDFIAALSIITLLFPVYLFITILLAISLGGNPFFKQVRNGRKGKVFKVIKFRTMTNETDSQGKLLPNSQRLTKVGGIIRKLSLDELPQLFNILSLKMSFIGPRPLPVRYFPYFYKTEEARFKVQPGISGLAQVSGRNHLDWDKRIGLDVKYVEQFGPLMDLRILLKTIYKVIKKEDVVIDPTQVMIDFDVYRKSKKEGDE